MLLQRKVKMVLKDDSERREEKGEAAFVVELFALSYWYEQDVLMHYGLYPREQRTLVKFRTEW